MTRVIKIRPSVYATARTRDRIETHGPLFRDITPVLDDGHPKPGWTLVSSLSTSWYGWLPNGEFLEL